MNLNGRRQSTNVDDRRGSGGVGGKLAGGGIVAVIVAALFAWISGGNPLEVLVSNANQLTTREVVQLFFLGDSARQSAK